MAERVFGRLWEFTQDKRRAIIFISLILIVASLFGAMRISYAAGTETFLSSDSQAYKDFERFNEYFGSSVIVILVTGDNIDQLLRQENLEAMEYIENRMGENPNVISAVGPTFLMKQAVATYTGMPTLPNDPQTAKLILIDPQDNKIRAEFGSVFPDTNHVLIPIVLEGMYHSGDEVTEIINEIERAVAEAGFIDVEIGVTGTPALVNQMQESLESALTPLFIVAIFLMLLILALIFRARGFFTWRWLPLAMVGIGIVYTFAASGLLNLHITMISVAVFPILIGLGIDYSIQLHGRYDEEMREGKTSYQAMKNALSQIGPSIGIAVIAISLSFVAMSFSPVPMIQDFGLMLLIGVSICYVIAIFILPMVLFWRDNRAERRALSNSKRDRIAIDDEGLLEKGIRRLAPIVINNRAFIIPVALAITVAGLIVDFSIDTDTDLTTMMSERWPAMKNYQQLQEVMSGEATLSDPFNVLIEGEDLTDPAVLTWMCQFGHRMASDPLSKVCSTSCVADLVLRANGGEIPQSSRQIRDVLEDVPAPIRRNLISDDYRAANFIVGATGSAEETINESRYVIKLLNSNAYDHPDGITISVTGSNALGVNMFDAVTSSRLRVTIIGVGLIFMALFVLFRFNIIKALMAIIPIGLIIGWSSGLMYISDTNYSVLTTCLGALILGIGVEYTVVLIRRYYEERGKGDAPREAMITTMVKIGRTIIVSGLTTIGGFAALLAAIDFPVVQNLGIMTMIAIFFALVSTLVLLPTLVVSVDSWREKRRLLQDPYSIDVVASD